MSNYITSMTASNSMMAKGIQHFLRTEGPEMHYVKGKPKLVKGTTDSHEAALNLWLHGVVNENDAC